MPAAETEEVRSGLISVKQLGSVWTIECRGRKFGSYQTQESAIWDAIATAVQARTAGKTARVELVDGGAARTIWPRSASSTS
jgi:hypothetical protein